MSTKYQMWLTYNAEKEKIQLPVLPESFEVNNGSNNESMNITGLGEIVIMQSRPALQFSWSCFFPATKFPGLQVSKITKPLTLVQKINTWKASKKPVHLIVTACGVDVYATTSIPFLKPVFYDLTVIIFWTPTFSINYIFCKNIINT